MNEQLDRWIDGYVPKANMKRPRSMFVISRIQFCVHSCLTLRGRDSLESDMN